MIKKADIISFFRKSVPTAVLLAPQVGLFPKATQALANNYNNAGIATAGSFLALALLATDQYLKYVKPPVSNTDPDVVVLGNTLSVPPPIEQISLKKWTTDQPFTLWGQHFKLEDFMTSCLIVGTSGTGKTSAGFDHFLNDMTTMLYSEDAKAREAKFGGFFLDVKNQFFVRVLYFMARSGRNPLTDLKVISPYSQKIVGEWEDPDTGFRFFMNASHFPTGTAVSDFLAGVQSKNGADFPENILSVYDSRFEFLIEQLKELTIPVGDKKLNLIGWRYHKSKLLRVVRNIDLTTLDVYEKAGKRVQITPPKNLRFIRKVLIESGTQYNIIDNSLPASAISQQLMKVAKLASGGGGGGNDAFWVGSTEAQVINCINLWRIIHKTEKEITGPDILKFTTNQDFLDKYLKDLKDRKRVLGNEVLMVGDDQMRKQELEDSLKAVESITTYFTVTWAQKDVKQRTTVEQMIINLFNVFQNDEHLKRSFCSPATYNFKECMNDGRVFVLVPGADYSENAKVIGTLLKLHFQKVALERVDSSTMNRNRVVIFGADEVQRYVVAASASEGDPDFNNLSRESMIINIVATQTDASIADLIKSAADSYFSSHGIRLYFNVDESKTRKRAVELCAQTRKETKYKRKGEDLSLHNIMEGKSHLRGESSDKEEKSFTNEDFINLKKWESICFNKFAPNYKKPLAVRFQNKPHEYGAPDSGAKIKDLVDWYQTANLETCLFEQDLSDFVDHDKHIVKDEVEDEDIEDTEIDSDEVEQEETAPESASGGGGGGAVEPAEPDDVFQEEGSFEEEPEKKVVFFDDDEEKGNTPAKEEKEPGAVVPDEKESTSDTHSRPRSAVAARVHKDSGGEMERGNFSMFSNDNGDSGISLPDSVSFESSPHENELESVRIQDADLEAERAEISGSPASMIAQSLEGSFGREEAENLYNQNQIADQYENWEEDESPHSSIDSITTGVDGFASDKDNVPQKKGQTTFSAREFSPKGIEPASLKLDSVLGSKNTSPAKSYNSGEKNKATSAMPPI